MLDNLDNRILRYLQNDPESSIAELAEKAATTSPVVSRRLAKLQQTGHILGHELILDWSTLGFEVQVSLRVTLDKTEPSAFDEFLQDARKIKEVLEIQTFLGMVDVRLSVVARDMKHYQDFVLNDLGSIKNIGSAHSTFVMGVIKHDYAVPI